MTQTNFVMVAALSSVLACGCDEGGKPDGAAPASASAARATSAAASAPASATSSAALAPSVAALPAEPAPTTVQVDLAAMRWKELKTGKTLELVDTELGTCGLPGWHLPLPKGVLLSALSPAQGKGCSAKNMPGPPGTQLMVVVDGPPLAIQDIQKVKAITFEASDGYILEHETAGTPPFYPRVERTIDGTFTSCSLTYVDFDTARAAYELCRKLEKKP